MTQRLLIIGGGIQGMMSASAAAQFGARSELIVTEHALGPMAHRLILRARICPTVVETVQGRSLESAQWP